jgi:hypothetical protein
LTGRAARSRAATMKGAVIAMVATLACARQAHWPPKPADDPPTAQELAFYELTVRADDPEERAAFASALAARGFNVVDHPPRKGHLEVFLTHEGETLVATLRSDDFFVDEALGSTVEQLAHTLAVSQRVADFIRNSGLPQQRMIPGSMRLRSPHVPFGGARGAGGLAELLPD